MIDDELDLGNITDGPAEVQTTAKFRPKARAKPRKPSVVAPSRSPVPNPTVETAVEEVGALGKDNGSQEHYSNQETTLLTCLGSKTVGDATGFRGTLDTPTEDGLTVSLIHVNNRNVTLDSSTGGVNDVDIVSRNQGHNDDLPVVATHQENLVVSDTQASSTHSIGKTIEADLGGLFDAQVEDKRVARCQPKIVRPRKAVSKLQKTNQKTGASTVVVVSQKKEDDNNKSGCNNDQLQDSSHQEIVKTKEYQASLAIDESIVDNLANPDNILEEPVQEDTPAKFQPKFRPKPSRVSYWASGTNDIAASVAPEIGFCDVDVASQDTEDNRHGKGHNDDPCQKLADHGGIAVPDTCLPQNVGATVRLDSHDDLLIPHADGAQLIFGKPSDETTVKFQPNIRSKKHKGKKVSFVLADPSEEAAPTDTDSDMGNLSHSCNGPSIDENLNITPQETAEKEYAERQNQHHDGGPSDHAVEQQPKLDVRETGLSMKLRSREKMKKVGIPERTVDVNLSDFVEPSAAVQDNDSGDEYTVGVGGKQKLGRKSKDKDINKKPSRGSKHKHTSKDSPIEELQQQQLDKNKSVVSSRNRKRTSKDTLTEQPEKKLTHRIRQKRMKEVKTLLETPDHEIDRMKLSVAHLRMLQEARERTKGKEIPPGKSSYLSSLAGDMDDFDNFGVDNYDNDRTDNHVLENETKLNYHSYMNKQARAKWSKSDSDLFYQGLQQFGTDFGMIQQLFPDKTRNQVRQKFKTEEKRNPIQVRDAMSRRSRDSLFFRQVIKQLNIDDVQLETNYKDKQQAASNEGFLGHENELDNLIRKGEENGSNLSDNEQDMQGGENGSNWSDKEQDMHRSKVKEGEHVSANADDDLDDVFDWY